MEMRELKTNIVKKETIARTKCNWDSLNASEAYIICSVLPDVPPRIKNIHKHLVNQRHFQLTLFFIPII